MNFNNLFWLLIGASYGGEAVAFLEGRLLAVSTSYFIIGCLFAAIPCALIEAWQKARAS